MPGSTTYLLEVRRPSVGGFLALLRAVDQETTLRFDSAQALGNHLEASARAIRPAGGPPSLEPLPSVPQETLP